MDDKYYSPDEMKRLIKESGCSICISCHNNAYDGTVGGFEVIHSIHSDGKLAKSILSEASKTGIKIRRAFSRASDNDPAKDYYGIIRTTYPEVETVIVEFGFMDNKEDFDILTDPVWQDKLTSAVCEGISSYLQKDYFIKTPIIGSSILKPVQLEKALTNINPSADIHLVELYYSLASDYKIKADLAFLQATNETNWFKFTGVVKKTQNNYGALGATGPDNPGASFDTAEEGIEAHLQHLFAYATLDSLPEGKKLLDPRFFLVKRGISPCWEDLNGKWAIPGTDYGQKILKLQEYVFNKYPLENDNSQPSQDNSPH